MKLLKDKRFRYGTFSTTMMLLAAFLFVFVNLLADDFNNSRDLTAEQIFSLSAQSRDFMATLDTDVTIYYLAATGQAHYFHQIISQLLEEYAGLSPHLRVDVRDPFINPAFVHQLATDAGIEGGLPELTVIVQSGGNMEVVLLNDMVEQEMVNWFTGETRIVGLNFEREITRAIHRVTQGEPPVIYHVTGSGEAAMQQQLITQLEGENFIVRDVNLMIADVPESADILFITQPARDWTELKAERIQEYLENGGRAFIALGMPGQPTPNIDAVLAFYGVMIGENLILEGDSRHTFMGTPYFILPTRIPHEITSDLIERDFNNLLILPSSVETMDIRRASIHIEPLLGSTRNAFARVDLEEGSVLQVPGDIDGPFDFAVAVQEWDTQLVIVSNHDFLDAGLSRFIGPGNMQFVVNSMRWLGGQATNIWVPGRRPPGTDPLMINDRQANTLAGVAMGIIPLTFVGIGVAVRVKRKKR